MKRLYYIAWTLFLVGLLLRFLHIGIAGYVFTLGALLMFIHSVRFLFSNYKSKLLIGFLYLFCSLITIYLTIRFQFWNISIPFFFIIFAFFFIILIMYFVNDKKVQIIHFFSILYFVLFVVISTIPTYKLWYCFYLNDYFYKNSRDNDYRAWNVYSIYLYHNSLDFEANEANIKAINAIQKCLKNSADNKEALGYLKSIEHSKQLIQDRIDLNE